MEYKLWKKTTFIFKRTPLDIRNKHHLVLPKQTETISKKLNNSLQEFMSRFHFNCSVHSLIIWKLQTINFITICLSYWMIFNEKQMSRVVTKKWWKIRLLKLRSTNLHKTFPWIFLWQSATFSAILQNICETCLWSQNEQIFFCAFLPCRAEEIISRR